MNESNRLGKRWTETELIIVIDMFYNFQGRDSHGHDEVAKILGRYNPHAVRNHDGPVNEKLAEIKGYVDRRRQPRHPGSGMIALIDRYRNDPVSLRAAARVSHRTLNWIHEGRLSHS